MKIKIFQIAFLFLLLSSAPAAATKGPNTKPADDKADTEKTKDKHEAGKTAEVEPATGAKPTQKAEVTPRHAALVSRLVLKVLNPEETKKILKKATADMGGFPLIIDEGAMVLKIPPDKLSKMVEQVSEQGILVEKFLEREDLTQQIAEQQGRLKSKKEILARLKVFLADSDAPATLEIEQTMTSLVREIERVQGTLRVLTDRSTWARVDISFQFREREKVTDVRSPFEWLNSANLDRFLKEF